MEAFEKLATSQSSGILWIKHRGMKVFISFVKEGFNTATKGGLPYHI